MKIKQMTSADLDFAAACVAKEGWLSETREVFETFLKYDPAGCLLAEVGGERVGMGVATPYQQGGFIGELIVLEQFRGMGYGRQLLDSSINYLKSRGNRDIFLDGDLAAIPLYEKTGFRKICRSLRFLGNIPGQKFPNIRPVNPTDLPEIFKIDFEVFGEDRSFFLKERIRRFPELCLVQAEKQKIVGYILGRPGQAGLISAGPWAVQDSAAEPIQLLQALAAQVPGAKIRIGVLENNLRAVNLLDKISTLARGEYSWRMVLGNSTRLGMNPHIFAIGSAAKG